MCWCVRPLGRLTELHCSHPTGSNQRGQLCCLCARPAVLAELCQLPIGEWPGGGDQGGNASHTAKFDRALLKDPKAHCRHRNSVAAELEMDSVFTIQQMIIIIIYIRGDWQAAYKQAVWRVKNSINLVFNRLFVTIWRKTCPVLHTYIPTSHSCFYAHIFMPDIFSFDWWMTLWTTNERRLNHW